MDRNDCIWLVREKIMRKEKLTLDDIDGIKAVVHDMNDYLDNNDVILKETAKEILTFVDFMNRTAIHAKTFQTLAYRAFHDNKGASFRSEFRDDMKLLWYGYTPREHTPEEMRVLEAWAEEYGDNYLKNILLGRYDFRKLEEMESLNNSVEYVYKPAMHAVLEDYIYAAELDQAIWRTGAYFRKGDEPIEKRDKQRRRLYIQMVQNAEIEIRYNYLENRKFDHGLITDCLQKMRKIMQRTAPGTIDMLDFLEILNIYGVGTQEMFRFNEHEENVVSLDFFVESIKELINNA